MTKPVSKQPGKHKVPVNVAAVARTMGINPKSARAKFRAMKDERPFDHTKVKQLTPAQVKAAKEFLSTDYRLSPQ